MRTVYWRKNSSVIYSFQLDLLHLRFLVIICVKFLADHLLLLFDLFRRVDSIFVVKNTRYLRFPLVGLPPFFSVTSFFLCPPSTQNSVYTFVGWSDGFQENDRTLGVNRCKIGDHFSCCTSCCGMESLISLFTDSDPNGNVRSPLTVQHCFDFCIVCAVFSFVVHNYSWRNVLGTNLQCRNRSWSLAWFHTWDIQIDLSIFGVRSYCRNRFFYFFQDLQKGFLCTDLEFVSCLDIVLGLRFLSWLRPSKQVQTQKHQANMSQSDCQLWLETLKGCLPIAYASQYMKVCQVLQFACARSHGRQIKNHPFTGVGDFSSNFLNQFREWA